MPYFTTEFNIMIHEFRTLNSHKFSVMNSYYEFIKKIRFMNSDWTQWILISEIIYLLIHIWIQDPYIWIHISEFISSWIHIFISYMNSDVYGIHQPLGSGEHATRRTQCCSRGLLFMRRTALVLSAAWFLRWPSRASANCQRSPRNG